MRHKGYYVHDEGGLAEAVSRASAAVLPYQRMIRALVDAYAEKQTK